MRVLLVLLLATIVASTVAPIAAGAVTALPQSSAGISVTVDANGVYTIHSTSPNWTLGGTTGADLSDVETSDGRDTMGQYREVSFHWQSPAKLSGSIRNYEKKPVLLFSVTVPSGAPASDAAFPRLTRLPANLHKFSYGNSVFAPPSFSLERNGTPWMLFDDDRNAFIISPASDFMVASMSGDGITSIDSGLNSRLEASDKPLTHKSILTICPGIGAAWQVWGQALTDLYGKKRPSSDADPTLKHYGIWTDNGARYYYSYDKSLGYAGTLTNLVEHYVKNVVPPGYLQLDSWWYPKSADGVGGWAGGNVMNKDLPKGAWNRFGGMLEFEGDRDLFPDGVAAFQKEVEVPLVVHNRWVDPKSPYQEQFRFSGVAAIDPAYWKARASYLADSGVTCYEQDWMNVIYDNSEMAKKFGVGEAFMDGMANACGDRDITMQYCMALPRHFLQGAKYSNLTSIRTSGDRFNRGKWRSFLFTSQLASALGIWPWCDVFMSTETDNMIISVLSAGVVGTGDLIWKESAENILRAARLDGVMVKPDVPVVPTDDTYVAEANNAARVLAAWTRTDHGSHRTVYLIAFTKDGKRDVQWQFRPSDYGIDSQCYAYDAQAGTGALIDSQKPCKVQVTKGRLACLTLAPLGPSGISLVGDEGKIASMGKQRVASLEEDAESVTVTLRFAKQENSVVLHGYSAVSPAARTSGGRNLSVDYDRQSGHFRVTVPAENTKTKVILTRA